MKNKGRILINAYYRDHSVVQSLIDAFNDFIDFGMQQVVDEEKEIEPTIIPANLDEYKIRFGKIRIGEPIIIEADGSPREMWPTEARIRQLTYASPIFLELIPIINGIIQKPVEVKIGMMPIMLKSKYCRLSGLSKDELIKVGEDPNDPGGYFIINGSEKTIVTIEDLAPNTFLVSQDSTTKTYTGKIFSESGAYRIPLTIEQRGDLIFYVTFTRLKRIPIVLLMKALGITTDQEIMKIIVGDSEVNADQVLINIYEYADIKDEFEAMDAIAKMIGLTHPYEIRIQRVQQLIDQFLLPHLGREKEDRKLKAYNLGKYVQKLMKVQEGLIPPDDRDHYMNKRLKTAGDSLLDLFRFNFRILIRDMMYNFQRIVKRGKLPPLNTIVRDKLFTSRVYSAMATGSWVGERKGVAQRFMHWSFVERISHLQRVSSMLNSSQENFEARALHPTHFGRLCPIETPEGKNVGLRKNFALLSAVTRYYDDSQLYDLLEGLGLNLVTKKK